MKIKLVFEYGDMLLLTSSITISKVDLTKPVNLLAKNVGDEDGVYHIGFTNETVEEYEEDYGLEGTLKLATIKPDDSDFFKNIEKCARGISKALTSSKKDLYFELVKELENNVEYLLIEQELNAELVIDVE